MLVPSALGCKHLLMLMLCPLLCCSISREGAGAEMRAVAENLSGLHFKSNESAGERLPGADLPKAGPSCRVEQTMLVVLSSGAQLL